MRGANRDGNQLLPVRTKSGKGPSTLDSRSESPATELRSRLIRSARSRGRTLSRKCGGLVSPCPRRWQCPVNRFHSGQQDRPSDMCVQFHGPQHFVIRIFGLSLFKNYSGNRRNRSIYTRQILALCSGFHGHTRTDDASCLPSYRTHKISASILVRSARCLNCHGRVTRAPSHTLEFYERLLLFGGSLSTTCKSAMEYMLSCSHSLQRAMSVRDHTGSMYSSSFRKLKSLEEMGIGTPHRMQSTPL